MRAIVSIGLALAIMWITSVAYGLIVLSGAGWEVGWLTILVGTFAATFTADQYVGGRNVSGK